MKRIKRQFPSSVMTYITLSMVSIIAVGLMTIFISFWITELADKDAQAINLSGSMRMQTYHIALALEQNELEKASSAVAQLNNTWNHSIFTQQRQSNDSEELDTRFDEAFLHWNNILKPLFEKAVSQARHEMIPMRLVDKQVHLTDALVDAFQNHAEEKIRNLRAFQLFALFITISVGSIVFYITKNRIEKPLHLLSDTADKIGKGNFGEQVDIEGRDELAQLGSVINEMSTSIKTMYSEMDDRVKQRTEELYQRNVTLKFLFNIARSILDNPNQSIDYQSLLNDLSLSLGNDISLEFCLFTAQGERPYLHISPEGEKISDCSQKSCANCQGSAPFCPTNKSTHQRLNTKYPIVRDALSFGVINVSSSQIDLLPAWQEKLLLSVADQFALALSLAEQKDKEHRLAMLNERTVIARELHDSLAQSLSYLQIQATRLQKSHDKQRYDLQQPIMDELREGLSSAYRQLRELLTTFRLKMDAGGLQAAIENTVEQLAERSGMEVSCTYTVKNIPLTPSEEIHLLQIIREGLQNAVNHSQGTMVNVSVTQSSDKAIELRIEDDGVGLPESPEKLNHYGLAIMKERSRHLCGDLDIQTTNHGGTSIIVTFVPAYVSEPEQRTAV